MTDITPEDRFRICCLIGDALNRMINETKTIKATSEAEYAGYLKGLIDGRAEACRRLTQSEIDSLRQDAIATSAAMKALIKQQPRKKPERIGQ